MIEQSLWVLLLGMAGIFIVMGVIALTVSALNHFCNNEKKGKPE
jgi:Na+-transporting methylmalonyl-CoA/oxaloacetate decarboxylase gamma subunit